MLTLLDSEVFHRCLIQHIRKILLLVLKCLGLSEIAQFSEQTSPNWETFKIVPEFSNAERPVLSASILTCGQQRVSAPFAEWTANKSDAESFIFAESTFKLFSLTLPRKIMNGQQKFTLTFISDYDGAREQPLQDFKTLRLAKVGRSPTHCPINRREGRRIYFMSFSNIVDTVETGV